MRNSIEMKRTKNKLGIGGAMSAAKEFNKAIIKLGNAGLSVKEAEERMTKQFRHNIVKRPDLILGSDFHLREDQPVSRTDNFWEAQWNKIDQIAALQRHFDCPVAHAGDLYHHWKPSPYLLSETIKRLPNKFFTIVGQHDMPQHSMDLMDKTGIATLVNAGAINWLKEGGNFEQEPTTHFEIAGKKVAMIHRFVWDGLKIPWPGCDELTARQVLAKYPQFDLIVTGDHHKPFVQALKGRLLVNCGCLTRQDASYADHDPRVWLWYADTNTVEPYYLEVAKGAVSRDHLERKKEENKRIDAFITRLSEDWEVGLSFEENLDRFLSSNKIKQSVKELVYKAIDNE